VEGEAESAVGAADDLLVAGLPANRPRGQVVVLGLSHEVDTLLELVRGFAWLAIEASGGSSTVSRPGRR